MGARPDPTDWRSMLGKQVLYRTGAEEELESGIVTQVTPGGCICISSGGISSWFEQRSFRMVEVLEAR